MKTLIAIESCHKDRNRHQAQRDTWLKDLPADVDYRFFIGNNGCFHCIDEFMPDEVQLQVEDTYNTLSLKTRAICRWAWDQGYDYLHKTDTDTLVNVPNLLTGFHHVAYLGGENEDNMPEGLSTFGSSRIKFASGGAGYWLNRRAIGIMCHAQTTTCPAEDVYVAATLAKEGITPFFNGGYRWRPGSTVDENVVSLHLSSALQQKYEPAMMYKFYEALEAMKKSRLRQERKLHDKSRWPEGAEL